MYKVKYGFIGALIGAGFGTVMWCGQRVWAYISCGSVNSETTVYEFTIGIIIGLIIGIIVGANADKEAKLAECARRQAENEAEEAARLAAEQEAICAEKNILSKWKQERIRPILSTYVRIDNVDDEGNIRYDQGFYKEKSNLEKLKAEAVAKDKNVHYVSYVKTLQSEIDEEIQALHDKIQKKIKKFKQWKFESISDLADCLCELAFLTGDNGFLPAAIAAHLFDDSRLYSLTHIGLNNNNYGNVITPVDTDEKMNQVSSKIDALENKIKNSISQLIVSSDKYYSSIAKYLYRDMLNDAETIMWYYAKKKPFDTEKFEEACRIYRSFIQGSDTDDYDVIEMIARVYAKQALGGEATVEADRKVIEQWIVATTYKEGINIKNIEGQAFASALAWMGLYHIELNVLKQLVQQKVQLDEEVQERLHFLSEGGISNMILSIILDTILKKLKAEPE